ncbi:unnamed protein product [Chrysoparadoxa australica]
MRAFEEAAKQVETWESDDDEDDMDVFRDQQQSDNLHNQRVHAWVLVRGGKREQGDMVYIEPATGVIYPVAQSPFLSVEAIFNAKNFWVNMQKGNNQATNQSSCENTLVDATRMSYDLLNTELWEYALIDPLALSITKQSSEKKEQEGDTLGMGILGGADHDESKAEADSSEFDENILDLPPSWCLALNISSDAFALRYPPHGQRTIFYRKSKLELYAENLHPQAGMVLRLTLFKDRYRGIIKETRELYVNRQDRLRHRVRYPITGRIYEAFYPGRPLSLKSIDEWTGHRRVLNFYVEARLDGLKKRTEDIGQKITEIYEDCPDGLVYRSLNIMTEAAASEQGIPHTYVLPGPDSNWSGSGSNLVVYKMTEKYERMTNNKEPGAAKRTFYVGEGCIRTMLHYGDSQVTRGSHMHYKDTRMSTGMANGIHKKARSSIAVPQPAPCLSSFTCDVSIAGKESLRDVVLMEKECFSKGRNTHVEMMGLRRNRYEEEQSVVLSRPIYETAKEQRAEMETATEAADEEEKEQDSNQVKYLTPFLQHVPDVKNITKEHAQRARDACLKALKDRLLERANIINTRLNEENSALAKKQAAFQRNHRDNDATAEEEFEKFCSEGMFRIQILEQRLVQHEEKALKKYADMDSCLAADPRLAALYQT